MRATENAVKKSSETAIQPGKVAALVFAGGVVLYGVSSILVANYFINYALIPGKDGKTARMNQPDRKKAAQCHQDFENNSPEGFNSEKHSSEENGFEKLHEEVLSLKLSRDAWLDQVEIEQVGIKSADGRYDLAGFIYPAMHPSANWVILIHGYSGSHHEMETIGSQYAEKGFNVFAPDLRTQGVSEGKFVGMGWLDRLDMLAWMEYLLGRFGTDIQMIMHGHSMGGATTCMVSGEQVPTQLRAAISDCSYTSAWAMFSGQLKSLFKLPAHPALDNANLMFRLRGGYDLKRASAINQVKKATIPMLFIHGSSDTFIPPSMVFELYEACASPDTQLLVVAGAEHTRSATTNPRLYFKTVFNFLATKITI